MRQRLALIAVEKNNVARFGLLFAQPQAQAHPFHFAFRLTPLSACAGAAANGTFFSQGLGQLRTADTHALARFVLGAKAGDRPVAPVRLRFFQQGGDDARRLHSSLGAGLGAKEKKGNRCRDYDHSSQIRRFGHFPRGVRPRKIAFAR